MSLAYLGKVDWMIQSSARKCGLLHVFGGWFTDATVHELVPYPGLCLVFGPGGGTDSLDTWEQDLAVLCLEYVMGWHEIVNEAGLDWVPTYRPTLARCTEMPVGR